MEDRATRVHWTWNQSLSYSPHDSDPPSHPFHDPPPNYDPDPFPDSLPGPSPDPLPNPVPPLSQRTLRSGQLGRSKLIQTPSDPKRQEVKRRTVESERKNKGFITPKKKKQL